MLISSDYKGFSVQDENIENIGKLLMRWLSKKKKVTREILSLNVILSLKNHVLFITKLTSGKEERKQFKIPCNTVLVCLGKNDN